MTSDHGIRPVFPAELRLTGHGLTLREWTDDDLTAMVELFDNPDVAYRTPLVSPFDLAAARDYLQKARRTRAEDLRLHLAITTDGQQPQGEVLLARSNSGVGAGSIGYSVGAAHRGRRLATRAVRVMTEYAHQVAAMPRVLLEIEGDNDASTAVARAAGFHLTDAPPIRAEDKGCSFTLLTWAHGAS
ncbi:MAG: Acetyltransferase including N-acetylase of ribosomal protein-like protein [Actinomycetia bacterium]|nr:Acetyltransferase including N-acetylase of ribosomal protein-like protein [Actinomycetes bacterium]